MDEEVSSTPNVLPSKYPTNERPFDAQNPVSHSHLNQLPLRYWFFGIYVFAPAHVPL